jgi:hypothetical protein
MTIEFFGMARVSADAEHSGASYVQLSRPGAIGGRWFCNFNSVLELEGPYTGPFGPLSAFFDAAIGKNIAEATAATLLADIASQIEAAAVN